VRGRAGEQRPLLRSLEETHGLPAPAMAAAAPARGSSGRRTRLFGGAVSVVAHLSILVALLAAWRYSPKPADPEPMTVALVGPLSPAPEPTPPAAPQQAPERPPPPRNIIRPTHARNVVNPLPTDDDPTADTAPDLSEGDLAGAATAGSGSGGGACNMVQWLQNALRKDALVQNAVSGAHRGKAMMVWNGDWVRSAEQDGKGLAAVREAIIWEVAFAPAACRAEPVHGLVLISLGDAQGAARLVVGSGTWRWTDLLAPRAGVPTPSL
jgi:hypothetical protein